VPENVIREYAGRNLTITEIASELKVSYRTVSSMLHYHQIPYQKDHWLKYPPDWFSQTCRVLSEKGWSVGRIAGTFETSTTTVRKYLGETTM
jgi:orotate phosphoribosyltransferase-like protein